jgi:Tfp pilus assembly protein PilN
LRLQKQKEELKRMASLKKIETGEISKIEILKELAQLLPGTVWIWNLKYGNREVEINGFAESASDLIPLLDKSLLFERVEFVSPTTRERVGRGPRSVQALPDKEMERFKIKMRLEARRTGT